MPAVGILECFFGGEMADTNHGRRQGVAKEALTPRPPPSRLAMGLPPSGQNPADANNTNGTCVQGPTVTSLESSSIASAARLELSNIKATKRYKQK